MDIAGTHRQRPGTAHRFELDIERVLGAEIAVELAAMRLLHDEDALYTGKRGRKAVRLRR